MEETKTIKAFVYKSYGCFIDLVDVKSAVSVNPKNSHGTFYLFRGGFFTDKTFNKFELTTINENEVLLWINLWKDKKFIVGKTSDKAGAEKWIKTISEIMRGE